MELHGLWQAMLASLLIALGLGLIWHGLRGAPRHPEGLLRQRTSALGRTEGWRRTILGLALLGLGIGWLGDLRWLLFLAAGIGFVEVLEASAVIAAWKREEDRGSSPTSKGRPPRRSSARGAHQPLVAAAPTTVIPTEGRNPRAKRSPRSGRRAPGQDRVSVADDAEPASPGDPSRSLRMTAN